MAEGTKEYLDRKMKQFQDIIQEATEAQALGAPIFTDGFNPQLGGAFIELKVIVNESKLNEFRNIKKGDR